MLRWCWQGLSFLQHTVSIQILFRCDGRDLVDPRRSVRESQRRFGGVLLPARPSTHPVRSCRRISLSAGHGECQPSPRDAYEQILPNFKSAQVRHKLWNATARCISSAISAKSCTLSVFGTFPYARRLLPRQTECTCVIECSQKEGLSPSKQLQAES